MARQKPVETLRHGKDRLRAFDRMGCNQGKTIGVLRYKRKDKRLYQRRDPQLPRFAANEARGDIPLPTFHEPVKYDFLGPVHDQRDRFPPFVDDFKVLYESLDIENVWPAQ